MYFVPVDTTSSWMVTVQARTVGGAKPKRDGRREVLAPQDNFTFDQTLQPLTLPRSSVSPNQVSYGFILAI